MIHLDALEHALAQDTEAAHLVDRDLLAALVRAVRAAFAFTEPPAFCACTGPPGDCDCMRRGRAQMEELLAALAPFRPEQA